MPGTESKLPNSDEKKKWSPFVQIGIVFVSLLAVSNVLALRRRLIHVDDIHRAASEAAFRRQSHRQRSHSQSQSQNQNQSHSKSKSERSERTKREAEEEDRRHERYRRMKMEEEKEKEKFNRAYARWKTQNMNDSEQRYWDGQSFGHGWDEGKEEERRREHGGRARAHTVHGFSASSHHWHALGLDSGRKQPFTHAEIKSAFRKKAFEHHPDRNQSDSNATIKFRKALEAYETLTGLKKESI